MCGMCRSVTITSTAAPLRSRRNASSALWHARTRNPSFSIHATVRRNCNASSLITITVGGMAVCITGSPMQAAAVLRPLLYIGNTGENFTGGGYRKNKATFHAVPPGHFSRSPTRPRPSTPCPPAPAGAHACGRPARPPRPALARPAPRGTARPAAGLPALAARRRRLALRGLGAGPAAPLGLRGGPAAPLGLQGADFIGTAPWDHRPLVKVLVGEVVERLGEPAGIIVFDPSSFPKRGTHSVGVKRQWCGHPPTDTLSPATAHSAHTGAPPPGRHRTPFLSQSGLSLPRLGGLGESPRQWTSYHLSTPICQFFTSSA